jgi:hypothetical protein
MTPALPPCKGSSRSYYTYQKSYILTGTLLIARQKALDKARAETRLEGNARAEAYAKALGPYNQPVYGL